ncbi:hypothetical protein CLF_105709, partial [Clonorchis sinensis]
MKTMNAIEYSIVHGHCKNITARNQKACRLATLAKLIAGDSDDHTGAKERRLRPNKPYTTRQIRKLLAGFKVQSSEKTSLMGAPPKELPGAATQRSKHHRGIFPTKSRQNAQEAKQTRDRPLSNSEPGRPEEVNERATIHGLRNASRGARPFPLEYRRLRGDLILTYALFEQGLANRFFTVDPANTRRGH